MMTTEQLTFIDVEGADPRLGDYYVSAIKGRRFALLLGPFHDDH